MTIRRLAGHVLPTLARQAVCLFRRLPVYPAQGRGFHWSPVSAVRPWTTIAYRGLPLAIRSTLGTLQRSAVQPGCPWVGAELARLPLVADEVGDLEHYPRKPSPFRQAGPRAVTPRFPDTARDRDHSRRQGNV